MLKFGLADHRGYVSNGDISKSTGAHFNLPGHSLADLRVTVIEQTRGKNGFCLFGGNALLPFQKCPSISLDKMPLFKMHFLKRIF